MEGNKPIYLHVPIRTDAARFEHRSLQHWFFCVNTCSDLPLTDRDTSQAPSLEGQRLTVFALTCSMYMSCFLFHGLIVSVFLSFTGQGTAHSFTKHFLLILGLSFGSLLAPITVRRTGFPFHLNSVRFPFHLNSVRVTRPQYKLHESGQFSSA